jgi:hypothetical protein
MHEDIQSQDNLNPRFSLQDHERGADINIMQANLSNLPLFHLGHLAQSFDCQQHMAHCQEDGGTTQLAQSRQSPKSS